MNLEYQNRRKNPLWVQGVYLLLPLLLLAFFLQNRGQRLSQIGAESAQAEESADSGWEMEVSTKQESDHGHAHENGGHDHGAHEEPEADQAKGVVHVALRTQAILGIESKQVEKRDLALTLDLNGTIRPKPENIHDVHSPVEGIVRELHAFPGDWVRNGDPLVTLQVAKILEWQETLLHTHFEKESVSRVKPLIQEEGKASMIEFLGSLQAKSAETHHFQEELDILRSAGQGAVSRQEIHHKEGELKAARADLLAKRALALSYGISQQEIDDFEMDLELPTNPNGLIAPQYKTQIEEKEISLEKEKVLAETAKANLRAVGFPEDCLKRLEEGDTTALTDELVLHSMSDGLIVESDINLRQSVTSQDHLFRIVDYRSVYVEVEVPEMDISRAVNRVAVEMPVRPLGMSDEILHATTVYFDTTVHPDRRVAHLVAEMENLHDQTLREGMAVSVGLVTGYEEEVLVAPKSAVQRQGLESIVFVRDTNHPEDFKRKEVRVGLSNLNEIEVSSGLKVGEEIAVEGAFHLLLALQQASGEGQMDHGHAHH